jgi:hypothetical protein
MPGCDLEPPLSPRGPIARRLADGGLVLSVVPLRCIRAFTVVPGPPTP